MTLQNQYDKPKKKYFGSEDTSFVTGDSPVTLDLNTTLVRNSVNGYIINDGPGDFKVNLSEDGSTFGDDIRMKNGETLSLRTLDIDSISRIWRGINGSIKSDISGKLRIYR